MSVIKRFDPELFNIIQREIQREVSTLELIASENFASYAVLEAAGGVMTNKYAEGYPGKRYYGGCEHVDEAENLARVRLRKLFNAGYANVQPHSGSQANIAALMTFINIGDTVKIGVQIREGDRTRVQNYQGTIIRRHNNGLKSTITVRRIFQGVGIERIFPLYSPAIVKIEVLAQGKVRRAKLNYLRNKKGKAARLKARS